MTDHLPPDLLAMNRRAVIGCAELVRGTAAADLDRPSPCAGWTLADLLGHLTVQHRGFAAAARGHGGDPEVWRQRPVAEPPVAERLVAEHLAAVDAVLAAFADPDVPGRAFLLPEFSPTITFPAAQAIGFHTLDYLVHGWDVARARGVPYRPDTDLVARCVPMARAVPDGERRTVPGAAFRPALPTPTPSSGLDLILRLLGRSPTWPDA